jgi:TonB-dependent starch-binding outer membrane protein SusC
MKAGRFARAGLALLLSVVPAVLAAQERTITGRVTRTGSDMVIANAEIAVIGTNQVARTNEQGRFTLTAPAGEVRVQVRAIGYAPREIVIPPTTNAVALALSQDFFRLGDVVVTGQATTVERRSATTAIAYVSGEEVTKVAAPTFENALTGKVTGVNLQSNSGAPGGGIQMQIRGNNTILGAFDPLYVVDGVLYSNDRIAGGRGQITNAAFATAEDDAVNRVADINPSDIQSIEILKGAAASSIYGSKAANGVVVITTKRGSVGRPRVNIVQRFGQYQPMKTLESRKWTQAEAVARYGASVAQWFTGNPSPYFNHYDVIYKNSDLSYETLADISGGTQTTRYFVGASNKRDGGIEYGTGFLRQGLRINVDQDFGSRVDVKVSSVFNRSKHNRGWNNNCNNYACHGYAFPYTPSFVDITRKDAQGNFITPDWGIQSNTLQLAQLAVNAEDTYRFTGGVTSSFSALQNDVQNLRLVAGVGIDAFQQNNDLWAPNELFSERPQALPGESIENGGQSRFFNWNANAVHTYAPGSGWSATTSGGIQYEDRQLHTSRIRTSNLVPGQRNVGQGTITVAGENLTQERTLALYAQEEVRLLGERLLVQGGVRAERSSVNGDIDKFYVFPKISASYRWIDLMGMGVEVKPRFAYGETGNQPIFGQKFTLLGTPQLGGLTGFSVAGASGSPIVEPERVKEVEVGLDGNAMNGGLTWELTAFSRNSTNLLLQRVPAPSTGFTSQIFNGGRLENRGIEVGVGYTPIQNADVTWITRGTFTKYTNEVKDLAGLPPFRPPLSGFGGLGVTFVQVGRPVTQIIGRKFDSTGVRTATDVQLGNSAPDFRMGFVNDLTWRSFNLGVVLDYQKGGSIINLTQFLYDDARNSADFEPTAFSSTGAFIGCAPRTTFTSAPPAGTYPNCSEFALRFRAYQNGVMEPYIEDATFLKVREVSISYELPRAWFSAVNWGIDNARISLTGRNLASFQKYTGLDPEVANLGSAAIRNNLDVAPYPPSRSFFLNIALGF